MDTDDTENSETDSNVYMQAVTGKESEPLLNEDDTAARILPKVHFPSCRLVLQFVGFLGFVNVYCLRVNLSVALVAMLNHTQHASASYSENNSVDICVSNESTGANESGTDDMKGGEVNWDSHTQGTILAAFFYGYITTQV